MSFINPEKKSVTLKIIYFGPALAGKSTTLRQLHKHFKSKKEGKISSLTRNYEESAFFDFLPLSAGSYENYEIRFHLYAIPGPILYEANRRFLMKGIDGIVFVADSRLARLEENLACLQDLENNLRNQETFLEEVPLVMQYNKRDLKEETVPLGILNNILNPTERPAFQTIASRGESVVEPLKILTKQVLRELHYPG